MTYFRYRRRRGIALLVLIAEIIFLFAGCVPSEGEGTSMNEPPSYIRMSVAYSEANSQYGFKKEVLCTETAWARYCFEHKLAEELRQSCMETTDRILSNLGVTEEKPEIYIFDTFAGINIIENSLYTSQDDWKSADYVANVILAACGEGAHYGLAYGYGAVLCEQWGWKTPEWSENPTPENREVYDLNLLCFDESFVSEEDILAARQISYRAVKYLLETYGEETVWHLLAVSRTDAGMVELREKLREYYSTQSVDYSPSLLRFGYGGVSYSYVLESAFGTFYMGKDWTDANGDSNPLVTEGFLHKDYMETKAFFERNLDQMECYQRRLDLESYDNALVILFPNSKTGYRYSCYQPGNHQILVFNIDSLMHEYIHSLTKPDASRELWETEGFARYFSYFYDYYGIAFLNEDYNNAAESEANTYLAAFQEKIDRPIDMQTDFKEIENIAVYSRGYTDPNAGYVAGSSFIQYLIRVYGEAFVVQCIYGDESFPKAYDELVAQWNQYVEETCSDFSSYRN